MFISYTYNKATKLNKAHLAEYNTCITFDL